MCVIVGICFVYVYVYVYVFMGQLTINHDMNKFQKHIKYYSYKH